MKEGITVRAFGSVVERVVRILEVVGSIPTMSSIFVRTLRHIYKFLLGIIRSRYEGK
jgi:hypothetical protein